MNDTRHSAPGDRPSRPQGEDAAPLLTVRIDAPVPVSLGRTGLRGGPAPADADEGSIAGEEDPGAALDSLSP